jgi:hypothetical protein
MRSPGWELASRGASYAFASLDKGGEIRAPVPREIKSKEEFDRLLEHATEVRVIKEDDSAKVKLRTKDALYTFKTSAEDADAIVKATKTPVVEF